MNTLITEKDALALPKDAEPDRLGVAPINPDGSIEVEV